VLLMLAGGSNLGLFEVNEAADVITQAADPDANIIFGAVIDDSLGDEVKVTVIAAGFDKETPLEQQGQFVQRSPEPSPPSMSLIDDEDDDEDEVFRADPPRRAGSERVFVDASDDGDDLDVPSFLR
jgi:cell division protein FtsZ